MSRLRVILLTLGVLLAFPWARAENKPAPVEELTFAVLGDYAIDTSALDPSMLPAGQPPPSVDPQIPARIWAWQGKRVEVVGYMLPMRFKGDKVTEFMLFATPSACCYGVMPRLNEWINVKAPNGTDAKMDIPILVRGKFAVGTRHEEGYVTGIYHLDFEAAAAYEAPAQPAPLKAAPPPR